MFMALELIEKFGVKGFSYDSSTKLTHIVRDAASGFPDAMKGALQCMKSVDTSCGFNHDKIEAYSLTVKNAAKSFLETFLPGHPRVRIVGWSHPNGTNYNYESCLDLVLASPLHFSDYTVENLLEVSSRGTEVLPVSKIVSPVMGSDYTPVMRVGVYDGELVMDGRLRFGNNPVVNDALKLSHGIRLGELITSKNFALETMGDLVQTENGFIGSRSLRIFPAYELLNYSRDAWNIIMFFANNNQVYQPLIDSWDAMTILRGKAKRNDGVNPPSIQEVTAAENLYLSNLARVFIDQKRNVSEIND